jgi:predicted nucleotidyltransferase
MDAPTAGDLAEIVAGVLAGRPEILEGYLFGSTALGERQAHSDVDVAVYVQPDGAPPAPFGYTAQLTAELMRALRTDRIDLVVLNHAPPLLYGRVLRDGIRVFSRHLRATTTREGRALSRYCDFVPQLAKIEAAHHARVAQGAFGR